MWCISSSYSISVWVLSPTWRDIAVLIYPTKNWSQIANQVWNSWTFYACSQCLQTVKLDLARYVMTSWISQVSQSLFSFSKGLFFEGLLLSISSHFSTRGSQVRCELANRAFAPGKLDLSRKKIFWRLFGKLNLGKYMLMKSLHLIHCRREKRRCHSW
jgi:hypothetical protein